MSDEDFFSRAYDLTSEEETRAFYGDWAATYDQELHDQGYVQPVRVARTVGEMVTDRSAEILDVGCGTGLSGRAVAAAGFTHIDGGDYSPAMLIRAAESGVYRSLFEINLNESLSQFGDASYDVVTAVGCFSFGHISVDALDELVRILQSGGLLAIAVNDPYYDQGDLPAKLDALEAADLIADRTAEHGDHVVGHDVQGWVLTARVR